MSTDHAALAKTLLRARRNGALGTVAREPAGTPFVSLVAYALLDDAPVFFISALAEHTKNLAADPRSSLLVIDESGDPLAHGRVTLVGRTARIADAERAQHARDAFLAAHPEAKSYAALTDFAMHEMVVESARYVGGFGRMSWIAADAWDASR